MAHLPPKTVAGYDPASQRQTLFLPAPGKQGILVTQHRRRTTAKAMRFAGSQRPSRSGKAGSDHRSRAPLPRKPGLGVLGRYGMKWDGMFGAIRQAGMHKSLLQWAVRDFMNRSS